VASSGSERRPRIGISTYLEVASWGVWHQRAALVPEEYVEAVVRAGGAPLLLPPVGTDVSVLDVLDGLLLIGGEDLDPATYDAAPHARTTGTNPARDRHESLLLRAALDADLPLLAICRGAQLLVAGLGGTLHQHLPDLLGHEDHRPEPGTFGTTTVRTVGDSLVGRILGPETTVSCHHHQGLATIGSPLVATAWAEDGLVEAVELPTAGWLLAVQWHPEQNADDLRVFEAHVAAATRRTEAVR